MFNIRKILLLIILCLFTSVNAILADDCPAIVQTALQTADVACQNLDRNQACYGNFDLEAQVYPEASNIPFNQPGDQLGINQINSLRLEAFNNINNQWGVVVLKAQANLPDTVPGQNVVMVLFGDVELTQAELVDDESLNLTVSASSSVNVRQEASRDATLAGSLGSGKSAVANGRNADNSWLHIEQSDGTSGWVFAELLSIEGDLNSLPVLDATGGSESDLTTQAFYFRSGIGTADCLETPNGLLLQSPPGGPITTLNINGAWVSFGSTIFVQASPDSNQMTINTLAGVAQVQSMGMATVVIQGAQTNMQLDASGAVSSVPDKPTPLIETMLKPLVSELNNTQLIVPTYEDAKANQYIEELTDSDLIIPLTAENPVQAASQAAIDSSLDDLVIPIPTNDDDLIVPIPTNDDLIVPMLSKIPKPRKCPTCVSTKNPKGSNGIPDSRRKLIEGIWTRQYGDGGTSGDCSEYNGDNGGGVYTTYDPDDPNQQAQLCYAHTQGIVILDNSSYRWSGNDNTYVSDIYLDSYDNSSQQKMLSVIDDSHIDVVTTTTAGTCTVTTVVHYTLYAPGQLFGCSAKMPQIQTVDEDDSIDDVESTPVPEEELPFDPIKAGQYTMTWLPADSYCDADYKPDYTTAEVKPTSFDKLSLIVAGETFALSGDGLRGEFSAYGSNQSNLNITLARRFMDDFNVVWQASSEDHSKSCYAKGVLKLETASENQGNFMPPSTRPTTSYSNEGSSGDSEPIGELVAPDSGDYELTWSALPGMECSTDQQALVPSFTQATITASDTSFTIDSGTDSYQVDVIPYSTQWAYMEFNEDNSGVMLSFSEIQAGRFSGTYTYFATDGSFCIQTMDFKK